MAMNLEAVLRIAAQVTGLENITKLEKSLQGAEKAADAAKQGFKAVLNSSAWQATAAAAAGFGVAMGVAVKAAIDFESSMADVRKVVDGLESPKAFAEMKAEILDLSRQMPIAAEGFAQIYAAAGQSGIAKAELKDFALMVAQVAVAFDMTANDAGTALAQLRVSLGLTTPEIRSLADSMNYVSNNTGATASNLVEFMNRSAAVGKTAGLSAEQTLAFGAAMIQAGVQTEVAATSFNNLIKALSKGPSMTDRQISAFQRLGYTMVDAASKERQLTQVAEAESRRRLDVARRETDALAKEINRRYRNQLQALQDNWDDEAEAYEEGLQDQAEARINSLQRQQDAEIRAAQARANASGRDAGPEVDAIRQRYDAQIDAIRDGVNDELKQRRRADRDRQQEIRDQLEDQQEAELEAVRKRYEAREELEKQYMEQARADAKTEAKRLADESAQSFADQLQSRGAPMIMEVLGKIAALPKSQQISVMSDLFGDEARGLAPLISNLGELERVMGLATDKTAAAGSVTKEYETRAQTTANALQLMNNQLTALGIEVGSAVLPVMVEFLKALTPLIAGISEFARQNPVLTTAVVAIGGVVSALVLAAPFLVSVITLLGQLAPLFTGIAASLAGWAAVLLPVKAALLGFVGWLTSVALPAILAFFSGPVGWTVLAVAAVVAMAIAFREPIMKFLSWLWELGEPIRQFWLSLWESLKNAITAYFDWAKGVFDWGFKALLAIAYQIWVQPWINIWEGILRDPVVSFIEWLQGLWSVISSAFTQYVITPIGNAWGQVSELFQQYVVEPIQKMWTALVQFLPNAMKSVANNVKAIWTGVVNSVVNLVRSLMQAMVNVVNNVAGLINRLIQGFNALPGQYKIPYVPTVTIPQFAEGGFVDRPTIAQVGEGGEREYIIPESKMAAASARYLSGARGAAVVPSSGSGINIGNPQINVTTGPVMQQNGQQYVTIQDLERAMRMTAEGVIGRLRTPSARIALGMG